MNIFNFNTDSNTSPASTEPAKWHWGWAATLAFITFATLAFRYALPIRDGDIWWHMLYGKYFLEHKTLIADHTIFSWTPTTNDTIYCTWLSDIVFYLLYHWGGLPGLFTIRYLCLFTLLLSGAIFARTTETIKHPLSWFIILVALLMSYTAAFVKPEVISFALMTLLVWNWYHIRAAGEKALRNCYFFPVIMLAWVNSHGAFVFGIIFLLLIAFGEILNTWFSHGQRLSTKCRFHLSIALGLSAITPFITPYGYHYPVQLFFSLLPTAENVAYNNKISAYLPTFNYETPFQNFQLYADLAVVILIFLYFRSLMLRKVEWSSLLTNIVFAFLYTKYFRTTFYFAPVFAFSSLTLLTSAPPLQFKRQPWLVNLKAPAITVAACIVTFIAHYQALKTPEYYQWMGFGISESNPVSEAAYIKKYFPRARIGNSYDQGAYLLWTLWPENRVFFDSRHFPYRLWSDEFFLMSKGGNISSFLAKYPCDLWVISLREPLPLIYFIQSPDWQRAFYGKNAMVFVRKDLQLPDNAPRVSSQISDLKNLLNAHTIFIVACTIEDWPTTDKLIQAMEKNFGSAMIVEPAKKFRKAMRAYLQRDYAQALAAFSRLKSPYFKTANVESVCHQLLAAQAWQQKKVEEALRHVRQAWNLSPGNVYSLYNAGLIVWYQQHISASPSAQVDDLEASWQYYFTLFLDRVPRQQNFSENIIIAQSLLEGKSLANVEQLPLITPPEPRASNQEKIL